MPLSVSTSRNVCLPLRDRRTVTIRDLESPFGIDQIFRTARACQQDAAFLERLADRRDPEAQRIRIAPLAACVKFAPRDDVAIGGIDAAAGKHQRAGGELDLVMAHHHEDLDFPAPLVVGLPGAVT